MRNFVRLTCRFIVLGALLVSAASCGSKDSSDARVFVLGMDGMDPNLLQPLLDSGRMPNFARVIEQGDYKPLGTSTPPQSPVAWSNFITGCDPSVHNLFDFMHRDPKTYFPYLSSSRATESEGGFSVPVGQWDIPLWGGGGLELLRRGTPFWKYLTEASVPAMVFRMPSEYPPSESKGARYISMSGMGTPDIIGTYGICTSYSSNPATVEKSGSGAQFSRLTMKSFDSATGRLRGPENPLKRLPEGSTRREKMYVPFTVDRDPDHDVARITIQDQHFLLNVGEWSAWVRFRYETGFLGSQFSGTYVSAICKFHLKAVRPYIDLYVTPINIDPLEPFQPITEPAGFAAELAETTGGAFYTQGIPEDHSALSEGILNEDEYLQQVDFVMRERTRHLDYLLEKYQGGFFFFYFGSSDQVNHMFWNFHDPTHPTYDPEKADKYRDAVNQVYERMDEALGRVLKYVHEGDMLLVMSDHGFNAFAKGFNLNTWLLENGYLFLDGTVPRNRSEFFFGVDWSRTKAYGLGINCLYLNLRGREKNGIVDPSFERDDLLNELVNRLKQITDPETGRAVIAEVYRVDKIYPGADPEVAPDLLVGYNRGYRASWKTLTGKMPDKLIEINREAWSGDHCVATHLVPGIVVSNRKIRVDDPNLLDLGPTILSAFGIQQPAQMKGRLLF